MWFELPHHLSGDDVMEVNAYTVLSQVLEIPLFTVGEYHKVVLSSQTFKTINSILERCQILVNLHKLINLFICEFNFKCPETV